MPPIFLRLLLGTSNKPAFDNRSVLEGKYLTREFAMTLGPSPLRALYIRRRTLKSNLKVTGSQCRAAKTGLMCSLLLVLVNSRVLNELKSLSCFLWEASKDCITIIKTA